MNIGVHISNQCFCFLWINTRSGIAGLYGHSIVFFFLRKLHTAFHRGFSLHSYQQCLRVPFSWHPPQHVLFLVTWLVILRVVRYYLIGLLVCISLMTRGVEHLLNVPVGHHFVFFGKISIKILCPFLSGVFAFFFLTLSCISSLYILDILAPYQTDHLQISSTVQLILFSFCWWFPSLRFSV